MQIRGQLTFSSLSRQFINYLSIVYGSITVHQKNLQSLMIEIYKTMNHLNPPYNWEFFVKKDIPYNLRTKELFRLPSAQSHRYGLNSLSFRGSLLWNALDDELRRAETLKSV